MNKTLLLFALCSLAACDGGDAAQVEVPLAAGGEGPISADTDLGWTVRLDVARVTLAEPLLKNGEDKHAFLQRSFRWVSEALIPSAYAHPGHGAGGTVVGELRGDFVVDFASTDPVTLGTATAVVDDVTSVDFLLAAAGGEALAEDDPVHGHHAWLAGEAQRGDDTVTFTAALDLDEDTALAGAPVVPETVRLDDETAVGFRVQFVTQDPFEGDSFFDGVDFGALLEAAGGDQLDIRPGDEVHNRLRRGLSSHDHYLVSAFDPGEL